MALPQCISTRSLSFPEATSTGSVLAYTTQRQLESEWCWAAVSQAVADFYVPAVNAEQCAIVNRSGMTLGGADCCKDPSCEACNEPYYLEWGLTVHDNYARWTTGAASFADVQGEIDGRRPLCALIGWNVSKTHPTGGGHFASVYGYGVGAQSRTQWVVIGDPLYLDTVIALSKFPAAYHGGGDWTRTYWTHAPKAASTAQQGGAA